MKSKTFFAIALLVLSASAFGQGVDLLKEPSIGEENAPIVMEEYSDFQCPFCKRFHDDSFEQLKNEFIDTGIVRFVYRDFPLSFHKEAENAALAAQCALEQDKFWQMHENLFENQHVLGEQTYRQIAQDIGLDLQQFSKCFDSKKYLQEIQNDVRQGQLKVVNGTPSFFINDKKIVGSQPYETFRQAILDELERIKFDKEPKIIPPLLVPLKEETLEGVQEKPVEVNEKPTQTCSGCFVDGVCMGASSRFVQGQTQVYCGVDLQIGNQKALGAVCQNNFECLSNACSSGVCVDLAKELQETKGILQQVLELLGGLFGFKPTQG